MSIKTLELDAYVLQVNKEEVVCECVLDRKNKGYEIRKFSPILFEHIKPLEDRHPIRIQIITQPGTSTINIMDGKGIVDMSAFDVSDIWEDPEFLDACKHMTLDGWHQQLEGTYMTCKYKETFYVSKNEDYVKEYIEDFEKEYRKKLKYRKIKNMFYISYIETEVDEEFNHKTNKIEK